jgi:tetratricopeptide (TPR) repeat protein
MSDPRAYRIDPETLRAVPADPKAMRRLVAALQRAAGGDASEGARRLGEAGLFAGMLGDLTEAEGSLQRPLELAPASESQLRFALRMRRAMIWQWQSRHLEADREFVWLLQEASPQQRSFVLQHSGKSLFEQRRYQEAHAVLTAALALREARGEPDLVQSTRLVLTRVERALRG